MSIIFFSILITNNSLIRILHVKHKHAEETFNLHTFKASFLSEESLALSDRKDDISCCSKVDINSIVILVI